MQSTDVRHRGFLSVAHILQQRTGGADGQGKIVCPKALQIECAQLVREQPRSAGQLEVPARSSAYRGAVAADILGASAFRDQQLSRLEPLQLRGERLSPVGLQHGETPCAQIEPSKPKALPVEGKRGDEGLPALVQQRLVGHCARSDDANDFALYGAFRFRWVANLLAEGDALPSAHQSRQVAFDAVKRNARQGDRLTG